LLGVADRNYMHISGGKILGKKEQNLSPESLERKAGRKSPFPLMGNIFKYFRISATSKEKFSSWCRTAGAALAAFSEAAVRMDHTKERVVNRKMGRLGVTPAV